uniref:Uncharacterized protein n=1 Tax=Triticum urartu TaxID=4572 RepID=A0A8R7UCU2_TRIUA
MNRRLNLDIPQNIFLLSSSLRLGGDPFQSSLPRSSESFGHPPRPGIYNVRL